MTIEGKQNNFQGVAVILVDIKGVIKMSQAFSSKIFCGKTMCKKTIFSIILLLISSSLLAQNNDLVFERLNTSNGLSSNFVQEVFQDSKGYLWVSTRDGLNKYDGYKFATYRHDPDDSTSISDNEILKIYEDSKNNLWIGTKDGLNLYNREKENFTTINRKTATLEYMNAFIAMTEGPKGNLWMGVGYEYGLTKFDPETKQFTNFKLDSINIGNANVIIDIIVDKDEKGLWLGCYSSGLGYFDFETEEITLYKHDKANSAFNVNNNIREILQDNNGDIWVVSDGTNLDKFNPLTKEFTHYRIDPENKMGQNYITVGAIFTDQDNKNIIQVGTTVGLFFFDIQKNEFIKSYKSNINDQSTLSSDFITDIYKDRSGTFWIGTTSGLDKVDPGRVPFRHYNTLAGKKNWLNDNEIWAINKPKDEPDILWIGTHLGGLNRFDRKTNTFSYFKHDSTDKSSISNDWVFDVYEDPNEAGKILWVGTIGGGLNRFDLKTKKFKSYTRDLENPKTISSNNVRNIYKTRDGMLWITTSFGLNMFDRESGEFTRYNYMDTSYVETIQNLLQKFVSEKKPLAAILKVGEEKNLTQTFELKQKSKVLIANVGEGLNGEADYGWLESADGKTIWKFEFNKSRHAGGGNKNRMQIWNGELAPGQYKLRFITDVGHSYGNWNVAPPKYPDMYGIQLFEVNDSENSIISQNINKVEKPNSIVGDSQLSIIEDSYGMLWIGTTNGLSKLDRKTGKFTNYTHEEKNSGSISDNFVNALHEDKKGTLWIGTGEGLNRYDSKTNSFKVYTVKDGLPNDVIRNILEDKEGNLWLATNNGISKFNPAGETQNGHLTFINYNIQDGLQYNQYLRSSMFSADDGELFFGGLNGFDSFYPGHINKQPPRTILSNFLIFNKPVIPGEDSPLQKHISETEKIELSYDQNAFSFEFVALHFSSPEKNHYLYKMEGFDKDWIDGYRRYAPYTNLDPGDYTFRVKACNSDGVWNEEGASVKITILPPWWRTYWAYSGYFLFIIAIIFGLDRFQRRRLLAKTKERMKIQEAEHRAEAAELQAKVIQGEHDRKTKELEEARSLQLSMLPKELPQLPNLDIAGYMQTATEVGGDYYDFHVALDGTLTVVIGDATGHGMKAGTMVTTAKSLFRSYGPNPDILFSFQEIARCIKEMNFGNLSMCLTMLKIKGDKMQISTAAMPPSLIFRKDTHAVEEHMFEAMPLGTMKEFPYKVKDTTLKAGDTILLMSDGLPELKNNSGEMYGYKRIRHGFEDIAEHSPEEIISFLKNEGAVWANNEEPDDDVTFVVIKVK